MIRDMVQSHILQVFTLIAMEPPTSFQTNAIRDEKAKVLKSLIPIKPNQLTQHIVRGQYQPGSVGGEQVRGYREENGVAESSMTETYCALQLHIDNWRWAGVPFYIRTGKRLPKRVSEVSIVFKSAPTQLFDQTDMTMQSPNVLRLRIQPQEGISLSLGAKVPGQSLNVSPVRMDFTYSNAFGMPSPEAYERLILDAITGDSTLFAREDEVELSWQLIDSITKYWEPLPLHPYAAGEWGPQAADELLAQSKRRWLRL
jgi:glucose-6-phosphate 1-dehydrogenase